MIDFLEGQVIDGVPVADRVGVYVQALFAFKDDHNGGGYCAKCSLAAAAGPDAHVCFASLGPVSDKDLDHWVKFGDEFFDPVTTTEGYERWAEYREADLKRQGEKTS
jgi:hypothetical protein